MSNTNKSKSSRQPVLPNGIEQLLINGVLSCQIVISSNNLAKDVLAFKCNCSKILFTLIKCLRSNSGAVSLKQIEHQYCGWFYRILAEISPGIQQWDIRISNESIIELRRVAKTSDSLYRNIIQFVLTRNFQLSQRIFTLCVLKYFHQITKLILQIQCLPS